MVSHQTGVIRNEQEHFKDKIREVPVYHLYHKT